MCFMDDLNGGVDLRRFRRGWKDRDGCNPPHDDARGVAHGVHVAPAIRRKALHREFVVAVLLRSPVARYDPLQAPDRMAQELVCALVLFSLLLALWFQQFALRELEWRSEYSRLQQPVRAPLLVRLQPQL